MRGVLCALGWLLPGSLLPCIPTICPPSRCPVPHFVSARFAQGSPLRLRLSPFTIRLAVIGSFCCVFERSRLPHIRFPSSSPSPSPPPSGRGALNLDLIFLAGRSEVFRQEKGGGKASLGALRAERATEGNLLEYGGARAGCFA